MNIKAHLILPSVKDMMKECGLNENGKVQKYIDTFVFDRSKPYLPGYHLFRESKSANSPGSGEVIWDTPDAQFLYEGKWMVDPETLSPFARKGVQKILDPQNRDLHYHGGGLRNKDWINRMLKDNKEELIKNCQSIVNGGKNG